MDVPHDNTETNSMDDDADRRQIRELIENWALWRDTRDWARFRTSVAR